MIEVVKNNNKKTTFENIEVGTLFFAVYDDTNDPTDYETIFQKISPVEVTEDEMVTVVGNNAVVVIGEESGNVCIFEPYESVIPIYNAKFIIED